MKGKLVYFNGARYEGSFDGSSNEKFQIGKFTFQSGYYFKGVWKQG